MCFSLSKNSNEADSRLHADCCHRDQSDTDGHLSQTESLGRNRGLAGVRNKKR